MPPTLVATTGNATAIASIAVTGIPSLMLVSKKIGRLEQSSDVAAKPQEPHAVPDAAELDLAFDLRALGPFSDQDQPRAAALLGDTLDRPNRGPVVLEVIQPRNLKNHQITRSHADLAPHFVGIGIAPVELRSIDPVVDNTHTLGRNTFIADQRLCTRCFRPPRRGRRARAIRLNTIRFHRR